MANFVTDIFLVSARDSNMSAFILDTTIRGNDGNLYESSWRNKGRRLIGFKRNAEDEFVVTDITIISEDQDVPDDYAGCLITNDSKEKGLKKHILCYTRNPRASAKVGITDVVLVNPSKGEIVPAQFTSLDDSLNDIKICFKSEPLPPKIVPRLPPRRPQVEKPVEPLNNSYQKPVSGGIDGVPFQINAKYNKNGVSSDPIISSIANVSIEDLKRKYDYSFTLEREIVNGT